MAARESRDTAHALALTVESQRAQIVALAQALERMGSQRGQLDSRLGELAAQLSEGDEPVHALEAERQSALEERVRVERALSEARSALEGIDSELRGYEQTRHQRDEQAIAQREKIGQRKLDQQALVIKADQLSAAVVEAGFVLQDVIDTLAADSDVAAWERQVTEFDAKLRRLEPVNLAAIQEHAEASQRKEYLDAQNTDLSTALETLEEAIRKIDRETRGRFKDTFDRVNSGVQELYPRLFGGGHAYLELTGEDLLDTGVAIMARLPPESRAVLLAGRSRRAARRSQRRPLHGDGQRDERGGTVPLRHPQQGDDGSRAAVVGRHHARAGRVPPGVRRPRRSGAPGRRRLSPRYLIPGSP
jgi:chromosome segregation protein